MGEGHGQVDGNGWVRWGLMWSWDKNVVGDDEFG